MARNSVKPFVCQPFVIRKWREWVSKVVKLTDTRRNLTEGGG